MSGRRYELKATWGRGKESAECCAEKLYNFLEAIKNCDDVFAKWYRLGRSRKEALRKPVKTGDMAELLSLVEKGRHWTDVGRKPMDQLGFGVEIWNGGEESRSVRLSVCCGLYSDVKGVGENLVILEFPHELGRLADPSAAVKVLLAAVKCWNPDWGAIYTAKIYSELRERGASDPYSPLVDWIVFVPEIIENVPPPSTVLRLEGVGSVVTVLPHPPRREDPEQMQVINRIERIIRSHWRGRGAGK